MKNCSSSDKPMPFALAVLVVVCLCLSSGCITDIKSASFDVPDRKAAQRNTNFKVRDVSIDGKTYYGGIIGHVLKERLVKSEAIDNNIQLVPVPYDIKIHAIREFGDDTMEMLNVVSLGIIPGWNNCPTLYDIGISTPSGEQSFSGKVNNVTLGGWIFLPFQILIEPFDSGPKSEEEYVSEAISAFLTKDRYDEAVSAMSDMARKKLKEGESLSETDERLLSQLPDPSLAAARAKHPGDPVKAAEALKSVTDVKSLIDVATHAKLPEIRRSAALMVSGLDESEFAGLVRSCDDPDVGMVFLEHVSTDGRLAEIVGCGNVKESIRLKALGKISGHDVVASIAKSSDASSAEKAAAVEKLFDAKDEEKLYDIALNSTDEEIRELAFSKITESGFIKRAAEESKDVSMRLAALEKIDDLDTRKKIARNDENEDVRIAALSRVSDQAFLKEVADSDSSAKVHFAAVAGLTDEATLCEFAKSDTDEHVRRSVLDRIHDKATVFSVAEKDPATTIRLAAIERMKAWMDLNHSDGGNQTEEQAVFARIALNDRDASVRAAALRLVKDEQILVRAAKEDADPVNRAFAVSHISDSEILQNEEEIRKEKERLVEAERRKSEEEAREEAMWRAEKERQRQAMIAEKEIQAQKQHELERKEQLDEAARKAAGDIATGLLMEAIGL